MFHTGFLTQPKGQIWGGGFHESVLHAVWQNPFLAETYSLKEIFHIVGIGPIGLEPLV